MVFSFLIPSSITSEEPSISNNSLCCSSDTSSAVRQQEKTITSQWHSHCTDVCKEKQHLIIFGPVAPNWAVSLCPCARSHKSGFALPHYRFLIWGDSLGGFHYCRLLVPHFVLVKAEFLEMLSPNLASYTSVAWCYGHVGTWRKVSQAVQDSRSI